MITNPNKSENKSQEPPDVSSNPPTNPAIKNEAAKDDDGKDGKSRPKRGTHQIETNAKSDGSVVSPLSKSSIPRKKQARDQENDNTMDTAGNTEYQANNGAIKQDGSQLNSGNSHQGYQDCKMDGANEPTAEEMKVDGGNQGVQERFDMSTLLDQYKLSYTSIMTDTRSRDVSTMMPGDTGLYNLGLTCFANASLIPLFYVESLKELVGSRSWIDNINAKCSKNAKNCIVIRFAALFDQFWSGTFSSMSPKNFVAVFARTLWADAELPGSYQDSQEFTSTLLDAMSEETKTTKILPGPIVTPEFEGDILQYAKACMTINAKYNDSKIHELFNFNTTVTTTCEVCSYSSVRLESNNILTLTLPSGKQCELTGCAREYFGVEELTGREQWNCHRCKTLVNAKKEVRLWKPSKYLIVYLPRNIQTEFVPAQKDEFGNLVVEPVSRESTPDTSIRNDIVVYADSHFDMHPYLHSSSPYTSGLNYKLFAVTNQTGDTTSGHYTADVFNNEVEGWVRYNDRNVYLIGKRYKKSKDSYLLWYKQREESDSKSDLSTQSNESDEQEESSESESNVPKSQDKDVDRKNNQSGIESDDQEDTIGEEVQKTKDAPTDKDINVVDSNNVLVLTYTPNEYATELTLCCHVRKLSHHKLPQYSDGFELFYVLPDGFQKISSSSDARVQNHKIVIYKKGGIVGIGQLEVRIIDKNGIEVSSHHVNEASKIQSIHSCFRQFISKSDNQHFKQEYRHFELFTFENRYILHKHDDTIGESSKFLGIDNGKFYAVAYKKGHNLGVGRVHLTIVDKEDGTEILRRPFEESYDCGYVYKFVSELKNLPKKFSNGFMLSYTVETRYYFGNEEFTTLTDIGKFRSSDKTSIGAIVHQYSSTVIDKEDVRLHIHIGKSQQAIILAQTREILSDLKWCLKSKKLIDIEGMDQYVRFLTHVTRLFEHRSITFIPYNIRKLIRSNFDNDHENKLLRLMCGGDVTQIPYLSIRLAQKLTIESTKFSARNHLSFPNLVCTEKLAQDEKYESLKIMANRPEMGVRLSDPFIPYNEPFGTGHNAPNDQLVKAANQKFNIPATRRTFLCRMLKKIRESIEHESELQAIEKINIGAIFEDLVNFDKTMKEK